MRRLGIVVAGMVAAAGVAILIVSVTGGHGVPGAVGTDGPASQGATPEPASPGATGESASPSPTATAKPSASVPRPSSAPPTGRAVWENRGSMSGWTADNHIQHSGTIQVVNAPSYKNGEPSIEDTQTYEGSNGVRYHSEQQMQSVQSVGQDYYYGQAVLFPTGFPVGPAGTDIQQISPEHPLQPWLMIEIRPGNHLWFTEHRTNLVHHPVVDLGPVTYGTWMRVVTHVKLSATGGKFEIIINGVTKLSYSGPFTPPNGSPDIRWSIGLYVNWVDRGPAIGTTQRLYHAHMRIATSYALADPAQW